MTKVRRKSKLNKEPTWQLVVAWLFAIGMVFPFVLTISASFQPEAILKAAEFTIIPRSFTLDNYIKLLGSDSVVVSYSTNVMNSLKVSLGTCALSMVCAVMGAYSLSHYEFPGKSIISKSMLFMYVFPTILMISPIYGLLSGMKIIDTHFGLILVHTALVSPFCVWLLRSFFDSIPKEVEEAARIDGANRFQIITQIILPLAASGILTIAIYAMIYSWGEYTFTSILINSGTKKTIPLALAAYMGQHDHEWGRLLAACALNFVPLVAIFMPFLNNFLKGFTEGAVKQ